jgi:superfamily II DNA/RNA helicase
MQYSVPTPIQAQTIPSALLGQDVLGTAQTGTGKTAAYGIPLIAHLLSSNENRALVLTPTRELAIQVLALLEQMLGRKSSIKTALIIGGDSMTKQLSQLSFKPRLIVGTPGRVNDHLDRGTLKLDTTGFLVLDETDRMLDMGFGIQLEEINKYLPKKRQTLMFSATLPNNIMSMASKYLQNAVRVSIGSTIAAADTIKQEIIRTTEVEKHGILLEQLELRSGACIIFVKTKIATEKLANKLREHGHSADAIHGDLRQRNRERVIRAFRNKKHRILVATDVAARGLDIPHLEHVINFDLPQCEEDFIHRIGRTGRAGVEGSAISLITPQDHLKWRNISKMMNPGVKLDSSFDDPKGSGGRSGNNRRQSRNNSFKSNDRPTFRQESKPAFRSNDRPTFRQESKPAFRSNERPAFRQESKPAFRSNERPSFRQESKPAFRSNERPSFRQESKPAFKSNDRPAFRQESKPAFRSEGSKSNNGNSFKKFGESRSSNSFKSSSSSSRKAGGFSKPKITNAW